MLLHHQLVNLCVTAGLDVQSSPCTVGPEYWCDGVASRGVQCGFSPDMEVSGRHLTSLCSQGPGAAYRHHAVVAPQVYPCTSKTECSNTTISNFCTDYIEPNTYQGQLAGGPAGLFNSFILSLYW